MKKYQKHLIIIVVHLLTGFSFAQILPTPMEVTASTGKFLLEQDASISYDEVGKISAEYLAEKLEKSTGYDFQLSDGAKQTGIIFTTEQADPDLGPEGYILEITSKAISIRAIEEAGMFYAVQSLIQLFDPDIYSQSVVKRQSWQVDCNRIKDKPKHSWRGFMLDSSRQFQTTDFLKRYLDLLAMLKINVFHWHLTDNDGWRLEIKKYPKLVSVGSKVLTGKEQQGYYSQEEVKEIIEYAEKRNITVVPEIDLPGHSDAALAAYPEYSCFGKAPGNVQGHSPYLFCGGSEESYSFLEDVLDEVIDLFPSSYIHLGGDEAAKDVWDLCPVCQEKVKQEGLENSNQLQLYFSKRLAEYLKTKDKKAIFWGDAVVEEDIKLPENVVIQWWSWRKYQDLPYKYAIKNGYPIIAATNYYNYLNFPVTPWGSYRENRTFNMQMAYEENPSDLQDPHPLVLGMSTSIWTEQGVQEHLVDRRVFPRIYALAEQMWHVGERIEYEEFERIVRSKYPTLNLLGVDVGPASKEEITTDFSWD